MNESPQSPSIRLNQAHNQLIEALKSPSHRLSEQLPTTDLHQGERVLTANEIARLYKNQTLTQEHVVTLEAINQQVKQPLTRLQSSYQLFLSDEDDSQVRKLLQSAHKESVEQFEFMVHTAAEIAVYVKAVSEIQVASTESSLVQLAKQFDDFVQTFNTYSVLIEKATLKLR